MYSPCAAMLAIHVAMGYIKVNVHGAWQSRTNTLRQGIVKVRAVMGE